jgi:hypothetical protein
MRFGIGWIGKTLLLLLGGRTLLLLLGGRRVPKESLILEGKKGVRTWMILMMITRMKRIKLH